MWWYDYWPAHGMFLGPVFFIVMMSACVVMMLFMMRGGMMPRHRGGGSVALYILQQRFARGEIDKAECEERRRPLKG
jgi:uncharacterized membrane protein